MSVVRRLLLLPLAHTRKQKFDDMGCGDVMTIGSVVKRMLSTKSAADKPMPMLMNSSSHYEQPGSKWFSLSSRQEKDDERGASVCMWPQTSPSKVWIMKRSSMQAGRGSLRSEMAPLSQKKTRY
jgi:hypothetical protein